MTGGDRVNDRGRGYRRPVSDVGDERALGAGLSLSEAHAAGEAVAFAARGELDITSGWQLRRRLLAAVDGCQQAVVDLAGVTFMDSAGLGLLVGLAAELRRRHVTLVLRAPSPFVQRVLTLSGMHDAFPVESADTYSVDGEHRRR